jgi:alpha-mannosidase
MRQAGIRYFLTQKMSWNQFNKLPSHTFLWEGLDGSQVLTHFPPVDTYNSMANVKEVLFNISNYKDHDRSNQSYLLYGYGDGGGGPTRAMLEQLDRMEDLDGLPFVTQRTPQDFFQRLEADIKDPILWRGELYFEYHRGTYTTQADTKRDNRRSEEILHDVEFLSSIAHASQDFSYPTEDLNRLWKIVLTNQFHDIIPGSSITEVYEDSERHYQEGRFAKKCGYGDCK